MNDIFSVQYAYLIPLLPLIGAVIAGFFGKTILKGQSHLPIWAGVGASAILSIILLFGTAKLVPAHGEHGSEAVAAASHEGTEHSSTLATTKNYFDWIHVGGFTVKWGYFFDTLTVTMCNVVCVIGFFICVFAAGYMKGESGYYRFFAYLGLFIFMMTNLVMGENLIMLYLGWEGVGLCSYLLIGYYYDKPSAREAAKKAFLVNRVGDFGFALGIMLIYYTFGTISYFGEQHAPGFLSLVTMSTEQLQAIPGVRADWVPTCITWAPFLLMLGAFGKSAQFPLYVWLPDAMEGPTPVSALIHAATMVTAGVYMIARCGALFAGNEGSLITVAFIGSFTALFAGSIALRQFDLKKVFAYSTVSQLGFMFVGVGVLAPVAGVFHLVTHAFFKALLFLSSGVVMHAMLGHLDMRRMSGLKTVMPKTRWLMLIGCLALAGVIPFAGFWSKDEIVAAAWHANPLLGLILLLTAFMTAYYTFRLYFRVFEGETIVPKEPAEGHHGHDDHGHDDHAHADHHHNHEPALMIVPLVVLAIGAVVSGVYLWQGERLGHFLGQSPSLQGAYQMATRTFTDANHPVNPVVLGQPDTREETIREAEHTMHYAFMAISTVIAMAGIGVAYIFHLKNRAKAEAMAQNMPLATKILDNKFFVDEIYQYGIVEPLRTFGKFLFSIDRFLVDGIVNFAGFVPQVSGWVLKLLTQRGYLQGYAVTMLFGIVVILLVIFL
jgi:NADH-quinone oxidoreductase subunit L